MGDIALGLAQFPLVITGEGAGHGARQYRLEANDLTGVVMDRTERR
jgi:hypothetical protein